MVETTSQAFEHDSMANVERLRVREVPLVMQMQPTQQTAALPGTGLPLPPPPILPPQIIVERPQISDVMLSAFSALGYAVSARVLLFMSLLGAFVLAVIAMLSQSIMSAVIVTLFCGMTIIPLAVLEWRSKRASA